MAGHAASGKLVAKLVAVGDLERIQPDVGAGLAAHRGQLVLDIVAKRSLGIGKDW